MATGMWVRCLVTVQFTLPAVLLLVRVTGGGIVQYGWGWQMFSFGQS